MSSIIYDSDLIVLDMLLKKLKNNVIKDDELQNLVKRGGEVIEPLVAKMNEKYKQMEAINTD